MTTEYMRRALTLAESVQGSTSPNPWVGCVLVRDGAIVAQGATEPPPGRHAEAVALQVAGDAARGSTAYITLEPHNFHGRTPPCTAALIEAGVAGARIAMLDPNPQVSGNGIDELRRAGIDVEVGDGGAESARLLEAYLKHRRTGLPFVTAKFAATLDGKIAAASGDSRWVAGDEARVWAHAFRTKIDAIMCGVNNVLLDDPELTARPGGTHAERQPLRIVADSRGRTPPSARVLGPGGQTIIATTAAAPAGWRASIEARGGEAIVLPAGEDGRVDLAALLEALGARGVLSLLVEGGGVLHASFFARALVDKVHAIIAPKIVGGDAFPAVAGPGIERMADAILLRDVEILRLGQDVAFLGYPDPDYANGTSGM